MARTHEHGVESTASVVGHPIHPMLIPFPIAFLSGALVTDLIFWWTGNLFWAQASFWLIAGGLLTGALAAVFGLIDFLTIGQVRQRAAGWIHFFGNATALILAGINLWWRSGDPAATLLPGGLILSALIAGILTITGWYGGELSFRHRIGVTTPEGARAAEAEERGYRRMS